MIDEYGYNPRAKPVCASVASSAYTRFSFTKYIHFRIRSFFFNDIIYILYTYTYRVRPCTQIRRVYSGLGFRPVRARRWLIAYRNRPEHVSVDTARTVYTPCSAGEQDEADYRERVSTFASVVHGLIVFASGRVAAMRLRRCVRRGHGPGFRRESVPSIIVNVAVLSTWITCFWSSDRTCRIV